MKCSQNGDCGQTRRRKPPQNSKTGLGVSTCLRQAGPVAPGSSRGITTKPPDTGTAPSPISAGFPLYGRGPSPGQRIPPGCTRPCTAPVFPLTLPASQPASRRGTPRMGCTLPRRGPGCSPPGRMYSPCRGESPYRPSPPAGAVGPACLYSATAPLRRTAPSRVWAL